MNLNFSCRRTRMRITVAVMAFTLAACGQPTQTTVSGPVAATQP